MSIDVAPPQAATAMKPAPTPREPKPAKLTVPAKPAAISAANAATLAGGAVASTGPVGIAVAAAGAAGVGAFVVGRRVIRRRAERRATSSSHRSGSGLRMPGLPKLPGNRRSGEPAGGAGGRTAGRGAGPTSRSAGNGSTGRPSGRSAGSGAGRTRGPGGSSSGGAGSTRSGGGGRRSVPNRAARAAWRAAKATGRGGWGATKALGRGAKRTARAGHRRIGRPVWRWARRFVQHKLLRRPDSKPGDAKATKQEPKKVGDRIQRPGNGQPGTTTGEETPVGTDDPISTQPVPQGTGPVFDAARQFHRVALEHEVRGNLELRDEAYSFGRTLAEIANGVRARANYGLNGAALEPEYAAAVMAIAATVDAAAQSAARLGPAFDALHREKVNRLLQPKPGEQKWDTVANQ